MTAHELKTWPMFWTFLAAGTKTFEVRRNDRGFEPGDTLLLREWDPETRRYTGRELTRTVTYVLMHAEQFGVQKGFVVLGLGRRCDRCGAPVGYVLCDICDHSDGERP